MTDQNSNNQSWWTTLPGLITALATLITAVGGFIIIFNSQSCNKENQTVKAKDSTPPTNQQESPATQNDISQQNKNIPPISYDVQYDAPEIKFKYGWTMIIMEIRKVSVESNDQEHNLLKFDIRCKNRGSSFYFGNEYFRMEVDGLRISPSNSVNETVDGNSDMDRVFEFTYPKNAEKLTFLVEHAQIKYEIPLKIIPKTK